MLLDFDAMCACSIVICAYEMRVIFACICVMRACVLAQINGRVTPVVGGATGSDPPCHHLRHSGPPLCLAA